MRMATFIIPVPSGQAECSVFELSGQAGGLVDNVNRWRRQLGLAPETSAAVEAAARTSTGQLGDFSYFRLVNDAAPNKAFLVALLPVEGYTVFVKVACAGADISDLEPAFLTFCQSMKRS
jgi:hypothetical protein